MGFQVDSVSKNSKIPIFLLIGIGLLAGVGLGLFILFEAGVLKFNGKGTIQNLQINSPAPDFTLINVSGRRVKLSELQGKPVILNFWATWCGPCKQEMPLLQSKYEQHNGQFWLLAVDDAESSADVQAFAEKYSLNFDILLDPNADVQQLYQLRGYPTTYVLDSQGKIRFEHIGALTADQLDLYLVQVGVSR